MTLSASDRPGHASGHANDAHRQRGALSENDFARAKRHSRRVRLLKFAFPLAAVLIGAGFAGYSYLASWGSVSVDIAGTRIESGRLVMASPKLEGFTSENLPYAMTAARAFQQIGDSDKVELEGIDARLPIDAANFATIVAPKGLYDRDKNTLVLDGLIQVTTTDGMAATFRSVFVDIGKGAMTTSEPVDVKREGASVAADSMSVSENGKVFVFEHNVRMAIDPGRFDAAALEAGRLDASYE